MTSCEMIFFSQLLVIFIFFAFSNTEKARRPNQHDATSQHFQLTNHGYDVSKLKESLISEASVPTWLDCGNSCVETRFCVAYNFKKSSKENEINCQLSHTVNHNFERVSNEDNDWLFYEAVGERQPGCEEINECYNGGKMVWDPVKPFKCECTEHYEGELCEKKISGKSVTCSVLKRKFLHLGSANYFIFPRGADNQSVSVHCDMSSKNGIGVTEIGHDSEARTEVNGYEAAGSYRRSIAYDISLGNILMIINHSEHCEQFIKYECHYAHLTPGNQGWWVSRQGKKMNYWGGAGINSGKCACGMTNTCLKQKICNCDAILKELREDSGFLNDTSTLPVSELRFGDTGATEEYGYHTLGKLRCWG